MDINEIKKNFAAECQVVNLKYEYPGYTGKERFEIITSLTDSELEEKYSEILEEYRPYILLSKEIGEIRKEFIRNEDKYRKRQIREESIFGFDDDVISNYNPELINDEDLSAEVINKETKMQIQFALNTLTEIQKRRIIKYFYDSMTLSEIADEERVNKSKVANSIESGLKKMKLFFNNGGTN